MDEIKQIDKIMKWKNYVGDYESKLQPILNNYYDRVKKPKNEQLSIKEAGLALEKWKKAKNHTPPVGYMHRHIFNAFDPYDVVDELVRKNPDSWNAYHMPANLYTKLSLIQRYITPLDRTDIDRIMDPLDPKARCWNCGDFLQFKYKGNKKIPKRSEETVCQCNSGKKLRLRMDEFISQKREAWTAEKDRKKRQREKHERHIKRSAIDGD